MNLKEGSYGPGLNFAQNWLLGLNARELIICPGA